MINLFDPSSVILGAVQIGVLGLKVWALVDACTRPKDAFEANGKLTKVAWITILAVALLLSGGNVLGIFGFVAIIATIVYLVDVRPVVSGVQRKRRS